MYDASLSRGFHTELFALCFGSACVVDCNPIREKELSSAGAGVIEMDDEAAIKRRVHIVAFLQREQESASLDFTPIIKGE